MNAGRQSAHGREAERPGVRIQQEADRTNLLEPGWESLRKAENGADGSKDIAIGDIFIYLRKEQRRHNEELPPARGFGSLPSSRSQPN